MREGEKIRKYGDEQNRKIIKTLKFYTSITDKDGRPFFSGSPSRVP